MKLEHYPVEFSLGDYVMIAEGPEVGQWGIVIDVDGDDISLLSLSKGVGMYQRKELVKL